MEHDKLIKKACYLSVIAGVTIFLIKLLGWLKSDSISIFASLIDSLLDITSAVINVIAVQIALSPADDNHRFGHNKVQDLAIFGQAVFFISSGIFTFFVSAKKLIYHNTISSYQDGMGSMGLCLLIGMGVLAYQTYVIKQTNSQIIKSDKIHYIADCATNFAVIVSIFLSKYVQKIDAIFGILIALYIIYSAIKMLLSSIRNLIDEEFSKEDKAKILAILKNNKDILGVHDLKTRHAGDKVFMQMHIDLDPTMSLIDAHHISEEITKELLNAFPNSEVIIHQDPLGHDSVIEHREKIR
jgi:cation diffusion facilitator family transporter